MNSLQEHATERRPEHLAERHLEDAVRELDLLAEARDVSREAGQAHFARTLAKQEGLRIVLLGLERGARIPQHHAASAISVQVLRGRLGFGVDGGERELPPGRMLVVAPDLPHDLVAFEDSVVLLVVGGA